MSQNIYDDPEFFAGYSSLGRSVHGLEGAGEFPAIRAMLPDLTGLRVLDLGCGFGWFCRWAREHGAAGVLGIDISERMLQRARETTSDPAISYARRDMEAPDLPGAAFDLAYSSLALHYIVDLEGLIAQVHQALVPGGRLVVSVEHPIFTAPSRPGWAENTWPLDCYSQEGPRTTTWLAPGVIKQHRTIGSYVTLLLRQGFTLTHLQEWSPTDAQLAEHPEWSRERHRPPFLLLAAVRQEKQALLF
jgi:SAM-dependent methyltransferase